MTAYPETATGGETSIKGAAEGRAETAEENNINQLITDCARSKEALEKLYLTFRKSVFALAFSITADYHLSEDCVIETFVRLTQVRHFDAKKGDGKGYIHKIARNVALEMRRNFNPRKTDLFIQSYGDADKTVEDSIFINQLLKYLPDKHRQIVVMKICIGLTFREIAVIMRSPESTVKSRYARAMDILKEKAGVNDEKQQ